ncbi:hypothetical protein DFJ73DRAFT_964340 [Zopfochytrium polystomum]|nr:hypothetical protein DFJ73DRAFT_964340 [Zopfochytrium polystomum]
MPLHICQRTIPRAAARADAPSLLPLSTVPPLGFAHPRSSAAASRRIHTPPRLAHRSSQQRLWSSSSATTEQPASDPLHQRLRRDHPSLDRFPSILVLPLHWGDQDASGTASPVMIYRHFESGRLHYFNELIAPHLTPATHTGFILGRGIGRILKSSTLELLNPCTYPDTLLIGTRTDWVQQDRFGQQVRTVSARTGKVVAEGTATIVCFDHKHQRKADVPGEVLEAMRRVESNLRDFGATRDVLKPSFSPI